MDKLDLRADLEQRILQPRKKPSNRPLSFFLVLSAMSVVAILYYWDALDVIKQQFQDQFFELEKSDTSDQTQLNAIDVQPQIRKEERQARPSSTRSAAVISPMPESRYGERQKKEHTQSIEKQTVFNDNNYTPKGAVNKMPAPRKLASAERPISQKNTYRNTRDVQWTWESYASGFNKKKHGGYFTFTDTERGIDTNNVCGNYTYGSLIYRDCRKAAKKWFQDRCSNDFRHACLAGNMIP